MASEGNSAQEKHSVLALVRVQFIAFVLALSCCPVCPAAQQTPPPSNPAPPPAAPQTPPDKDKGAQSTSDQGKNAGPSNEWLFLALPNFLTLENAWQRAAELVYAHILAGLRSLFAENGLPTSPRRHLNELVLEPLSI
jgi:hypothetical protein